MKSFKKTKEFILKRCKELNACTPEYKRMLESETIDDIVVVLRDNANWVTENEMLDDKSSIKYLGLSVSNILNSGNRNSGYRNSGYRNSGDSNSGYWNSGDWNSGNWNSGDSNSGYRNSGYRNSGDRNSGNSNSGYWNSGNWNSGFFNSNEPKKIRVFNSKCLKSDWDNVIKPDFIYEVKTNEWVTFSDMSDEEKKEHKDAFVTDGYLKTIDYKEAWKIAFEKATEEDIELLKNLPNWNSKVFKEITGIKVK